MFNKSTRRLKESVLIKFVCYTYTYCLNIFHFYCANLYICFEMLNICYRIY